MTVAQLTIEEVEQQFKQWRLKKQPQEKIPNYLWDLVQQLMDLYTPSRIIKRLGLSTKQMRRKGLLPLTDALPKKNIPFVNINLPSLINNMQQLVIRRADGTQLSCVNLSDEQFNLSIKAFLNSASE